MLEEEFLIKCFVLIGIGSIIGWITNYIAIKMLFRPYKEINLIFFKIQGLLPRRKHEIGKSIAEVIDRELLSMDDIISKISGKDIEVKFNEAIDKILENKLKDEILSMFPMAALFLNDSMVKKIQGAIKNKILENKEELIKLFANYLKENIDIQSIIVEKVDKFSLEKIEEIICSLAKKELKHIEIIGAILGGIIGAVQFLVITII